MNPRIRRAAALALLALATTACEMTVDVAARLTADGAGSFRVVFAFDKEFIDVVRSTEQGAATLAELSDTGAQFGSGWAVKQTAPDGGLRLEITRLFQDPGELESALADVARRTGDRPLSFPSVFRDFRLARSSSFFRTSATASGTIDLTPERLVPGTEAGEELRTALQRAAQSVFRFRMSLEMPGRVGSYRGDAHTVAGGTISWVVPFGETLEFAASSSGLKTGSLLLLIGPVLALVVAGAWLLWRRRRTDRRASVPGWDVPATLGEAAEPVSAADRDRATDGGDS